MKYKLMSRRDGREFLLVFDTGDEVASLLPRFSEEQQLGASRFTAVGALSDITVGYFDLQAKKYLPIKIDEQVELVSLIGNIAIYEGKHRLHAHAMVATRDGTAHGGHLIEAHVRPTVELFLTERPTNLVRTLDQDANIPLIDIDASS
jgi:hypothetical protein